MTASDICEERIQILHQVLELTLSINCHEADLATLKSLLSKRESLLRTLPPKPVDQIAANPKLEALDREARDLIQTLLDHDQKLTQTLTEKRNRIQGLINRTNPYSYSAPTRRSWVG
jgi:hypothetical protein